MAAERAAPSGSRVVGMVCGLWVLVLVSSVLALEGKGEGRREKPPPPTTPARGEPALMGSGKDSEKAGKGEDT